MEVESVRSRQGKEERSEGVQLFFMRGGSSMGYKLAGYTVIGNCEIDPRVAAVYKVNNHPKHSFLMDIREFNKLEELYSEDKTKS